MLFVGFFLVGLRIEKLKSQTGGLLEHNTGNRTFDRRSRSTPLRCIDTKKHAALADRYHSEVPKNASKNGRLGTSHRYMRSRVDT